MVKVYPALAGVWLGAAIFFTFVVPEAAFATLGLHGVGPLFSRLFPDFYAFEAVVGAALVTAAVRLRPRGLAEVLCPALALATTLASWLWILPAVNRAIGTRQFGPLHGLSLGLQILSMLIVLAGLVAALRRPA